MDIDASAAPPAPPTPPIPPVQPAQATPPTPPVQLTPSAQPAQPTQPTQPTQPSPAPSAPIPIPGATDNQAPKKKEVARLAADAAASRALPHGLVRSLVLSYLLRNCHRHTAVAFAASDVDAAAATCASDDAMCDVDVDNAATAAATTACHDAQEGDAVGGEARVRPFSLAGPVLEQLGQRRTMMEHVRSGRVLQGLAVADELLSMNSGAGNVNMAAAFPMTHLRLLCQHFVELVRTRRTIEALAFAQGTIAPLGKVNPAGLPLLKRYLPLLAYHEPELSPVFELVDLRHRETLAEELNDHVFSYLQSVQHESVGRAAAAAAAASVSAEGTVRVRVRVRVERQSKLERLMRHLSVLMKQLEEKEEGDKWTLAKVVSDAKAEEE